MPKPIMDRDDKMETTFNKVLDKNFRAPLDKNAINKSTMIIPTKMATLFIMTV